MGNKKKGSLIIGSIIVLIIVLTPYFLYFYQTLPDTENIETSIGTIKGGYYDTARNFIYWFFSKLVPLLFLIIWFITNKHWWVHAIIIPISVYLFQLIAVLNDSVLYVDEVEFIYTIPLSAIVMVVLYFIRSKIAVYIQAVDLKKEMDEKMNHPKPEE